MLRRALLLLGVCSLAACAAPSGDEASAEEDEVKSGKVKQIDLTLYDSTDKFPRVMALELKSGERLALARCHTYWTALDDADLHLPRWAMVCRDANVEVTLESTYMGKDEKWTRWARVRFAAGGEEVLACKEMGRQDRGGESWDSKTQQLCTPKSKVDAYGKALFDYLEKPAIEKYPTRTPYLPTMWTKKEAWSDYAKRFAKAMPVGEYVGYGSTSAKKCKVKVAKEGDGLKVSIHSLDEAGNETRKRAEIVVDSKMTYGAHHEAKVDQEFGSSPRPASLLVASSESETNNREYFQRNLKVIRFHDEPKSVDAGHTAILVDDDYCQRLSPNLPAW